MEIDNIKNYISDTNHNSFMEIANELYELTSWLNKTYPGYKEWFYNKQIKGCLTPNRNIIFVKNKKGKIIALSCLKKDEKETIKHEGPTLNDVFLKLTGKDLRD